jgi:hypothetical protein
MIREVVCTIYRGRWEKWSKTVKTNILYHWGFFLFIFHSSKHTNRLINDPTAQARTIRRYIITRKYIKRNISIGVEVVNRIELDLFDIIASIDLFRTHYCTSKAIMTRVYIFVKNSILPNKLPAAGLHIIHYISIGLLHCFIYNIPILLFILWYIQ